jgi:hypothetical protein
VFDKNFFEGQFAKKAREFLDDDVGVAVEFVTLSGARTMSSRSSRSRATG